MKKSFTEKLYFGDILPVERGFKRNARLYKKFKLSQKEHVDLQIKALLRNKPLLSRLLEKLQEEGIKNDSCTKSQKSCTTV